MEARDSWTDIDGPVFFQDWEGPAGLTFVCLHGLGGNHLNWMRAAPGLSQLGRVLVPDFAGNGLTPRAGRSSGVPASRALLSAFIRNVAEGPVVLCGNSLGGSIALLQAGAEPETVRGVAAIGAALPPARGRRPSPAVLVGTAVYALPVVGNALGWLRIKAVPAERLVPFGFRMVTADASRVPDHVVSRHMEMARAQQSDPDAVPAFVQTTRSIMAMMPRPDIAHRYLDAIACPVLVMHGGKDRIVPLEPTLAATRPDWDVRVFPDLGHVIQLEAPELFVATIEDWLRSVSLL